jgi:hypothetical protein
MHTNPNRSSHPAIVIFSPANDVLDRILEVSDERTTRHLLCERVRCMPNVRINDILTTAAERTLQIEFQLLLKGAPDDHPSTDCPPLRDTIHELVHFIEWPSSDRFANVS